MSDITHSEYWQEVRDTAESIAQDGMADDLSREELGERLWETIDGHQWVIYTSYNYDVLKHSPNDGYSIENFGAEGIVQDGALNMAALAFGALYADVSDYLWELVEEDNEADRGWRWVGSETDE